MNENKVMSRSTHVVSVCTKDSSDELKEMATLANNLSYEAARNFAFDLINKCDPHDSTSLMVNVWTQSIIRIAIDLLENPFFDDEDREHILFDINNEIKLRLNKGKNHV